MKHIFTIIFFFSLSLVAAAQSEDAEQLYEQAKHFYDYGRFDSCEVYSRYVINKGSGRTKTEAYKLMALSRLEQGDLDAAGAWTDKLLAYDPYFTPSISDPQRFLDMIDERKQAEAGITTASRQAESIDEAPVPVTLITEDMIKHSGAQTLQELLCMYVPGMSIAEGTEANIMMHGISGLSQECVLVLQDGHRLNGQSTNAESVGPRNTLDKIQQIEVLRGPASSLYGNVALTAVVNIITRKGAAMNGARISGQIGTQNTWGTSFVVGGGNNAVDVLGWGSVYASDGFKHQAGNVTLYSGAYNRRPSYDIGIKARWRDFSITFNSQREKAVPYINVIQTSANANFLDIMAQTFVEKFDASENYSYDNYKNVNSNGPGITRTNHHLNLDYSHSFETFDLKASGYLSLEQTNYYNVMGDTVDVNLGSVMLVMLSGENDDLLNLTARYMTMPGMIRQKYVFQTLDWENISFGGQVQVSTKYDLFGHGNVVFGAQYEHFALTNASLSLGGESPYYTAEYKDLEKYQTKNSASLTTSTNVFKDGMEDVYSGYAQIKHYFMDNFIFNGGLRYDYKVRFNDDRVKQLSPRLSLIYKFKNGISARASYNYSFVDAPYIYRACTIPFMSGGADMKPESMTSIQLSAAYHRLGGKFSAEINGFYNHLEDFIISKSTETYFFSNSGKVKQIGIDGSAQYVSKRFIANGNFTWQRFMSANGFITYNNASLGMPKIMGNIIIAGSPYVGTGSGFFAGGKLWLRTMLSFQGTTWYQRSDEIATKIISYTSSIITTDTDTDTHVAPYNEFKEVDPQIIIGFGLGYEWKHIDIDVTLKNITNNQYKIGSLLSDGIPHTGRELIAKATLKF